MSSPLPGTMPGEGLWQEDVMNFPPGFNVANFELDWDAEAS